MNVGIYRGMIGRTRHLPDAAHQGRAALGPPLPEVRRPRRADAGGLRDRLGSDHAVPGRLADSDRRLRVGRDGRLPRRAGRAGALRDGGPRGAGLGRDRASRGSSATIPATWEKEGPFGEYTGHLSDVPTPRPTMKVTCITHRRDPIFRGCLEGTLPGSYSENSVMSAVQRAGIAWNILKGAGIPGIRDVYVHPITNGVNIVVQIRKAYQGQPKQIAAALWGNSAAQYRYKHVIVVDDDIDASSYEQIDWALAHRMNAGEGGLVVFPGIFGSPIDPVHADGGPRRGPARHRPLEPRALRRHALLEVRAPRGVGRRALPADRAPGARRRGARARALGRVRAGRSVRDEDHRGPRAPAGDPAGAHDAALAVGARRRAPDPGAHHHRRRARGLGRVLRLRRHARRLQRRGRRARADAARPGPDADRVRCSTACTAR